MGKAAISAWIPNINMGEDYDQQYLDALIHYDELDNLASFFGRDMPVHRHAQYLQIHYIDRGAINFHIDDKWYQVQGPGLFLTPPAIPHSFQTEADASGHVLTVHQSVIWRLTNRESRQALDLNPGSGICLTARNLRQSQQDQWRMVEQTLANIRQEWLSECDGKSLVLEHLVAYLVIQIARLSNRQAESSAVTNKDLHIFHRFTNAVETHYRDQWLLPDYTRAIGVSESRLNQICKRISNASPKKIITERILAEIKRLLAFSGMSVNEICYAMGFRDPAYFSRFFKRQTGMSPLNFRKSQLAG